eukprot:CAMPEP_0185183102 /NCGR_PEP_ID=MMETSP1140-20130426/1757_1 /TAXON_ID=298111 /ORGANISM="Pavlova sp., Strain CCMP459" /LENGTH=79 /DNA_ID=CAMNT_0027749087 /DNA_START=640 /DNA_END=876 /DNA_ORIENTATION=-
MALVAMTSFLRAERLSPLLSMAMSAFAPPPACHLLFARETAGMPNVHVGIRIISSDDGISLGLLQSSGLLASAGGAIAT